MITRLRQFGYVNNVETLKNTMYRSTQTAQKDAFKPYKVGKFVLNQSDPVSTLHYLIWAGFYGLVLYGEEYLLRMHSNLANIAKLNV